MHSLYSPYIHDFWKQQKRHFKPIFVLWICVNIDWNLVEFCSPGSNPQYVIISSDNGLVIIRRQAIISAKDILVFWRTCMYAPLYHKVLEKANINSNNGLAPIRRQAIIWISDCSVYWRINASFGLDVLRKVVAKSLAYLLILRPLFIDWFHIVGIGVGYSCVMPQCFNAWCLNDVNDITDITPYQWKTPYQHHINEKFGVAKNVLLSHFSFLLFCMISEGYYEV